MTEFVDPRSNPQPPARVDREPAAHGSELRELVEFCHAGRVYEVEHWIQEGRPIQALTYTRPGKAPVLSPLRTAIRKKHRDIVYLLLCNGLRFDLESRAFNSVLDEALKVRAHDILEVLLSWGADPTDVQSYYIIDTYNAGLIDRFWKAGVDYTKDPGFILSLASTVNKPLYGWLRKSRSDPRLQDALDVALLEAVVEDHELPVHLLLWAGADPHRKVPMARDLGRPGAWEPDAVFSPAQAVITFGRHALFDHLRVDSMPELENEVRSAHDCWTLKRLVALRRPADWSPVILGFIHHLCSPYRPGGSWDAQDALRFIASEGGRLTTLPHGEARYVRRDLLEVRQPADFFWLLKWLKKEKNCDPALYNHLTNVDSVHKKVAALNAGDRYYTPSQQRARAADRRRRAALRKRDAAPGDAT